MMQSLLLVALGGGSGSICRYLVQRWVNYAYPHYFPFSTFAVNIVGCFLIGLFWGMSFKSFDTLENWKLLLMTGFCGGFTTFSSFTLEGIDLLKENRTAAFFLYLFASVVIGLLATFAGMKITK